ncbi:MAG: hypothetical protein Q8Q09_03550 [Deltaproteobacteria bacterium]|nr:hypothetical protein [Deltaproteobacteria bacterium]
MTPPDPDERRLRTARAPLVDLSLLSLGSLLVARLVPRLEPWFGPPRGATMLLTVAAFVLGAVAFFRGRREPNVTPLDELAWATLLASTATTAGASGAPLGLHTAIHAATLMLFASRDPSDPLVVVAGASAALAPLVRAATSQGAPTAPVAIASAIAMFGFVAIIAHSRRAAEAQFERDALLREFATLAQKKHGESLRTPRRTSLPPRPPRKVVEDEDTTGWDALIEKLRGTVTSFGESEGLNTALTIDLSGLAPPSAKIRSNLTKIVQEAMLQTAKHTESRSLEVNVSRGRGGVHILLSDNTVSKDDGARHRRALAPLKGRVAPLGGTAEVERLDNGWAVRVHLPAEQLN